MISLDEAKALATNAFPRGIEALVEATGVEVVYSSLVGCDGWCVQHNRRAIIHVNSARPASRQRFTLAHELM